MDILLAARAQMALSLAFHMVFAALGIGLPLLMVLAEGRWLRTRDPVHLRLAKTWSKALALTFVVGAVSGTALSFELGLLWPGFMAFAGGIIGPAFALEGFAFFIEAIFIGLYLYGWQRLSPRAHWWCGVVVAISGCLSGILVLATNAWMQHPVGFRLVDGVPVDVDPLALFTNPTWWILAQHSTLSCYVATGFAVAGVYAWGWLRGRRDAYHRAALGIALGVGGVCAALMPLSGDLTAKNTARTQPAKLAAMEAHFTTRTHAPLLIGGWPNVATGEVHGAVELPALLSVLAHGSPAAEVVGLDRIPRDQWPNVALVHLAFQVMVLAGTAMIAVAAAWWWMRWRRREDRRWPMVAVVAASPLGFLALEAGWMVTEVGRQPWTVWGVLRTAEVVTPVREVPLVLFVFTALYLALGIALVALLRGLAGRGAGEADHAA